MRDRESRLEKLREKRRGIRIREAGHLGEKTVDFGGVEIFWVLETCEKQSPKPKIQPEGRDSV